MHVNRLRVHSICCSVLMLLLVQQLTLSQQVTKVGTTAGTFLSIPVGARAIGMGGAFVAVASDASAMYWNVAGIANLTQSEAIVTHAEWLAGISFNYGGIVLPLQDMGTIGLNITSMSMGAMQRTTEDLPEGTGETFTAGSFAIGVAYARKLTDWFQIGGNVKFVDDYIWNESASTFAVDLGTLFTTPFDGLKFGAGISNFGGKMQMTGDDLLVQKDISPINGNNPNINANLATDQFDLPLKLRIGLAYEVVNTEDQLFTVVADAIHPNDNSESVSLGAEYSVFQRMVSVRAGYSGIGMKDGEEQFTLGGGINYSINSHLGVKFDYGYMKFGRLDNIQQFSLAILF
jgi:hypothetical protein